MTKKTYDPSTLQAFGNAAAGQQVPLTINTAIFLADNP